MHLTPTLSSNAPRPPSASDPSPACGPKHDLGSTPKSATDVQVIMTAAQSSALGKLAQLAGVRADDAPQTEDSSSTAARLEEAISKAEARQTAATHEMPRLSIIPEGTTSTMQKRITPPSPLGHSQSTSPTASPYFAPSSPFVGTPLTLYGSASPGYPGSMMAPHSPQFAYYAPHPPAGYYQYAPMSYDQALRQASPANEVRLDSPMSSPIVATGDGFYAVSPSHPAHALYQQQTAAPQGVFYYTEAPEADALPATEVTANAYYATQSPYSPTQPMTYYGVPGYAPPSAYYAPQQAMYSPQFDPSRRYGVQPASPTIPMIPLASAASAVYQAQPPPELARGHLAQSRLHDAAYNRPPPLRRTQGPRSSMPKPPPHSDYALWVGNVPSDSNHAELWRFFTSRSGPSGLGSSTGVESIHLISRSNCAFVNYSSQEHLDHAIQQCNGYSLRPGDPRTKELVCRVRRKEDDAKSGVGAQRGRGMHHQYVRENGEEEEDPALPGAAPYAVSHSRQASGAAPLSPSKDSSAGGSVSTASTSSGFLMRHFKKRYFILKSHTEDDLRLSQERSLWATQPHNEPILDQAYRTATEGVFLVFSANKSGEFFGVARMAGPIFERPHKSSSGSGHSLLTATIPEDKVLNTSVDYAASPQPIASGESANPLETDPPRIRGASDPIPATKASSLQALKKEVESTGSAPSHIPPSMAGAFAQLSLGSSAPSQPAEADDDGVIRRDTILTPEERNARLEQLEEDGEEQGLAAAAQIHRQASQQTAQHVSSHSSWGPGWGRPFKVEWIHTNKLPFSRTKNLRNAFNANREVRVARDGTEIEPHCGESLMTEFTKSPVPTSPRSNTSLPTSPRIAQVA